MVGFVRSIFMVKKKTKHALLILASLFLCALLLFGGLGLNTLNAFAEEASSDKDLYLSSLDFYKSENIESGRPVIKDAVDANGTKMQLKVEGAWYTFDKGLYTHTNANKAYVALYYNIENYNYRYFTAYVGLNRTATKGDGVGFNVGTSVDGTTWTWMVTSPQLIGPQAEAEFISVDISGAKYLQLYAKRGGNNAHDHAAWADAKLTNSPGGDGAVMPLTSYDSQIKAKVASGADLNDKELELLVLQREFVSRVGQYALKRFTTQSGESDANNEGVSNEDNKAVLKWLLNDLDSLREFMLGGTPFGGSYYNSLTQLSRLYKHYKGDLKDTRLLNNKWYPNRTYGELYRTMMFSIALTHDKTIGSYLQASRPENQSEALRRYAIYRYMYETERFVATRNSDGSWAYETMNLFGSLKVEEMRWIMSNIIDDESILWLNDYVQTRINANPKNAGNLHTPHSYVRYTDPNYNNPVFYANENYDYFNKLFAVDYKNDNGVANNDNKFEEGTVGEGKVGLWDTSYTVPAGEGDEPYVITVSRSAEGEAKLQKVWMNFNNKFKTGSVCGGISKSGCNIRGARGIPANVIGQPGHAAILYYSKDANGNGSWKIDNDVGGWVAATKNERHLLSWGNAAWQRNSGGGGTVVFFHLAQECLNDYDNFVKAEEYTWLAKVYQGDLDKQENLYEKALTAQPKNLDAWYGLVRTYKAKSNKTAQDFGILAKRIGDTLYNHPMAMHCLLRLFLTDTSIAEEDSILSNEAKAVLLTPVFTTQLKTVEFDALTKAKTSGSTAAKVKANLILGGADTSVADFSFDGENAGCIVWADTYNDSTFTWKYSVDGKQTWKEVTFDEGQSHAYRLPEEDLVKISTENDIYVYIVGASPDNAYRIDVAAKPTMPDTLYANDWENRVMGVDGNYEWRYLTTDAEGNYTPTTGWISYAQASPDCTGNKAIEVRLKGTAKNPASDGRVFAFTADNDTAERKYISVNYLSMIGFSTQSKDSKRPNYAVNAIDGNAKTYWHTDYAESIKATENTPYLIIKLDVPRYISALEFVQTQYNASFSIFAKNVTVYVSEDGENWKEAGKRENFENIDDLKVVHFAESVYGQYVKLVMNDLYETNKNDGVFTTVSLVNLYEDTTKTTSPAGDIMPSLSAVKPSKNVFEGLGEIVNEDKAFEIAGAPKEDEPFEIGWVPGAGQTPDGTEPSPKSNAALWISLSLVGVALLAVAVVFVLCKCGVIKITDNNNTDGGSTPETDTSETKASAAKPKATTAETKVNVVKPKTTTTETKVNDVKPKTTATETKVNVVKPKTTTTDSGKTRVKVNIKNTKK